jgi:hypothetical protein
MPSDDVQRRLERLRFFDGDDAVLADLFHRVRDELADFRVAVGGDGAHLGDHLAGDGLGLALEALDDLLTARSMPRLMSIGLAPETTFFTPSR